MEEDEQQKGKINAPSEAGMGLYLGELRDMMKRLLQDEDIHNIIRYQTYKILLLYKQSLSLKVLLLIQTVRD